MKGVELIATLISLLTMLGITSLLGGIIVVTLNAVKTPVSTEMVLSPIYPPIKYETMLLSYLESTDADTGFQIKKILTYAAFQDNITNIFIYPPITPGNEEVKNLRSTTSRIFYTWLEKNGFIVVLNVDGYPHVLAQNIGGFVILSDNILNVKRVSIPLYIDVETMRKIDKDRELPLKVTLDLYVQ